MIVIKKTSPVYVLKEFKDVHKLTEWAVDYALSKGIDEDSYVRTKIELDEDENITSIEYIEDKDYTIDQLRYDGWTNVTSSYEEEEDDNEQ